MPNDIGKTLKQYRNAAGISVKEISDLLTAKGFKASESTIYSWENNNSQPTPGALLVMCKAYGISDVLDAFGYGSSPEPKLHTRAAHFDGTEYTEEQLDRIEAFAKFIKQEDDK